MLRIPDCFTEGNKGNEGKTGQSSIGQRSDVSGQKSAPKRFGGVSWQQVGSGKIFAAWRLGVDLRLETSKRVFHAKSQRRKGPEQIEALNG